MWVTLRLNFITILFFWQSDDIHTYLHTGTYFNRPKRAFQNKGKINT